jgi:hypothetical protein
MQSLIQIKDAAAGAIILTIYIEEAMAEELQSFFQCKMRALLGFLPHPGASACFSLSLFIVIDLHERRRVTAFAPRIAAENAALRHQLIVLRRKLRGRVQPANSDRWFLVQLYHWFPSILKVLTIIRPETLVRWHRAGFRSYWRWKSRSLGERHLRVPKTYTVRSRAILTLGPF